VALFWVAFYYLGDEFMGMISEAQNYQDYMISHTWANEEETTESVAIDGLKVEPTKPSIMQMITKIAFSPIGLTVLGLVGLKLVVSGFKEE
tara:strand:- start:1330 stop:1602 length:273 start_codon:yes stop_codon:yes gene_type:complete